MKNILKCCVTVVAFTLLLLSCKKNEPLFDGVNCDNNCFIISGKIVDTPSVQGIANTEVRLYFNEDRNLTIFRNTKYVGRTFTDANGRYQFRFNGSSLARSADGYYFVKITHQDHFLDNYLNRLNHSFQLDSSDFNKVTMKDFTMFRNAKLNLRIKGLLRTSDQVTISTDHGGLPVGWVLNGGRTIDTTLNLQVGGDIFTRATIDLLSNGVNKRSVDSIKVARSTTGQLTISF